MATRLAALNEVLADEIDEPLRIGIGVNVGPVIVGTMGYRRSTSFTAIGDPVNTASRLEALAKELDVQLVVAAEVLTRADLDGQCGSTRIVQVRGHVDPLEVHVLGSARDLPDIPRA